MTNTSTLPAYGSGNQLKVGETAEVLLVECGQHRGFGFLGQSDKIGVHDFDVVGAVNLDTPRNHPRLKRRHARSLEEGLEQARDVFPAGPVERFQGPDDLGFLPHTINELPNGQGSAPQVFCSRRERR